MLLAIPVRVTVAASEIVSTCSGVVGAASDGVVHRQHLQSVISTTVTCLKAEPVVSACVTAAWLC